MNRNAATSLTPSLPQAQQDQNDGGEVAEREREQDAGRADAERLHAGRGQRRDRHEPGREHVAGGDDARALVFRRPRLHGGERRHDEQAARDGEAGKIDGEPQAAPTTRTRPHTPRAAVGAV